MSHIPLQSPASRSRLWFACCIPAILFLLAALPLILGGFSRGRGAADQNEHYLQAIKQFAATWPHIDFRDYRSATTPGFLLAVAAVDRYISSDVRLLRVVGALFTLALLIVLTRDTARRIPPASAAIICLPFACSLYVFSSGLYLLPDNAGWLGLLICLILALRPQVTPWGLAAGGVALLLLVFVRQNHLWVAAVLWVAAWLGPAAGSTTAESTRVRLTRTALMLALSLPAFVLVAMFVRLWGGLTPVQYQNVVQGRNPAIPGTILFIFAIPATLYLPWIARRLAGLLQDPRMRLYPMLCGTVGLIAGALPLSSYQFPSRVSGIWNLVQRFPTIAGHSPLFILMSTLGGVLLGLWLMALQSRDRCIFIAIWITFLASQGVSYLAWQRYYEPFVLIVLVLMAARIPRPADAPPLTSLALIGPMCLSLLLSAVTFISLR